MSTLYPFNCTSSFPHYAEWTVEAATPKAAAEKFASEQWRWMAIRQMPPDDLKITVIESAMQNQVRASHECGLTGSTSSELADYLAGESKTFAYFADYFSGTVHLRSEVGRAMLEQI